MKERPILFSGSMVRALLAGTKTQTRRVVKPQPEWTEPATVWQNGDGHSGPGWYAHHDEYPEEGAMHYRCPYGQPGDRLWVREAFSGPWCMEVQDGMAAVPPSKWGEISRIWYWADGEPTYGDWTKPRPSIHMPRWASRITLEITEVRVERLQDISEADAVAEGAPPSHPSIDRISREFGYPGFSRSWYAQLWESINGEGSWEANPWVWCVEFKRVEAA